MQYKIYEMRIGIITVRKNVWQKVRNKKENTKYVTSSFLFYCSFGFSWQMFIVLLTNTLYFRFYPTFDSVFIVMQMWEFIVFTTIHFLRYRSNSNVKEKPVNDQKPNCQVNVTFINFFMFCNHTTVTGNYCLHRCPFWF